MNYGSRNKILLALIAVLLVANIVMLVLYFRMNKEHEVPKRPGFTERLRKEVGFTAEQMGVFEPKKKNFLDSLRHQYANIKQTKEEFYRYMYDPSTPDSVLNAKANVIGEQQKQLDLFVIRHFKDVRKMCSPEQLPKYDSLLPTIIERMTVRPRRK